VSFFVMTLSASHQQPRQLVTTTVWETTVLQIHSSEAWLFKSYISPKCSWYK